MIRQNVLHFERNYYTIQIFYSISSYLFICKQNTTYQTINKKNIFSCKTMGDHSEDPNFSVALLKTHSARFQGF